MKPILAFEMLDVIRQRPAFYLDGKKSLTSLRTFLVGYDCGAAQAGGNVSVTAELREFQDWVAERLGFGNSTSGWCNMILDRCEKNDAVAFDRFYELLDSFRKRSSG